MGRLKALPPALASLPPVVSSGLDSEGHGADAEPWAKWYHLARWKHPRDGLRIRTLERDGFTCQWPGCGRLSSPKDLVADHREPHRGNASLFWDPANLWTLCTTHHNSAKQAEERRAPGFGRRGSAAPGRMSHPAWFRKSHVPLTVVCGPPGSGKSTYVRRQAGPGDLIICFDELAEALFGPSKGQRVRAGLTPERIADVLRVRNERLGDLMRAKAAGQWPRAWLIVTDPLASDRQWWADVVKASIVVLATPDHECRRRIAADAAAGDIRGDAALRYVDEWWRTYRPAACDLTVVP